MTWGATNSRLASRHWGGVWGAANGQTDSGENSTNGEEAKADPVVWWYTGWPVQGGSASVPIGFRPGQDIDNWRPGRDGSWPYGRSYGNAYGGSYDKPGPGLYTGTSEYGRVLGSPLGGIYGLGRPYGQEEAKTSPLDALRVALENPLQSGKAAGQAWATYSEKSDPTTRAAVLQAKIANYEAMKRRMPFMGWYYDNEIAKLKAQLGAVQQEAKGTPVKTYVAVGAGLALAAAVAYAVWQGS